jgi:DNA-binding response OmpR family regulator
MGGTMGSTETPVVLVVEDDTELSALYARWLAEAYEVRTARTGEAAIERLAGVDIVLLDRRLPGMSGDQVLSAVRERRPEMQVAMLTGVEADLDVATLPVDDYITKPVDAVGLRRTVEDLSRRSRYEAATRRYYSLLARKQAIERCRNGVDRDDPLFEELLRELETARSAADEHLQAFDPSDYEAVFQRLGESGTATAN